MAPKLLDGLLTKPKNFLLTFRIQVIGCRCSKKAEMQTFQFVAVIALLAATSIQIDGQQLPTSDCGRRLAKLKPLIVNSSSTSHWPWHAAIYHPGVNFVPSYQCGGTLVTSNSVLTAGHCVSENNVPLDTTVVKVVLGRLNLDVHESSSQAFEVCFLF